jgi:hypothetical protein
MRLQPVGARLGIYQESIKNGLREGQKKMKIGILADGTSMTKKIDSFSVVVVHRRVTTKSQQVLERIVDLAKTEQPLAQRVR